MIRTTKIANVFFKMCALIMILCLTLFIGFYLNLSQREGFSLAIRHQRNKYEYCIELSDRNTIPQNTFSSVY